MKQKSEFVFSKWYVDCVGENGDTLIAYYATMKWQSLTFHYSNLITHNQEVGTLKRGSILKNTVPRVENSSLVWDSPMMNFKGTWRRREREIQRRLFENEEGILTWSCVMPRADVEISMEKSRYFPGTGYVEHLTLTLKPWLLPIDELRWGRFHSHADTLIWIDWLSAKPTRLVIHNGVVMQDCSINDMLITTKNGDCSLLLEERKVLQEEPILNSRLLTLPGLINLIPENLQHAHQCRWRSRGLLCHESSPPVKGWAIHEYIKFR
ncbi:MAG: hypothetical protein ACHQQQ_11010 [Bacteroidota bacterium]